MRIVIQIDDIDSGKATITSDSGTVSIQPEPMSGDRIPEAIDAGAPSEGQTLMTPTETSIGGQAVDAGSAPATAAMETEGSAQPARDSDEGELIDAGGPPDVD